MFRFDESLYIVFVSNAETYGGDAKINHVDRVIVPGRLICFSEQSDLTDDYIPTESKPM